MRDADLVKGQGLLQKAQQPLSPQAGARLYAVICFVNGKAGHMQVCGGNDDKFKIIKAGGGTPQRHVLIKLSLTAKKELHALGLGEGLRLADMLKILGLVPLGGTGHGAIPVVVGDADAGEAQLLGLFQNIALVLHGIAGAAGKEGMDVIIVVDLVSHLTTPLYYDL